MLAFTAPEPAAVKPDRRRIVLLVDDDPLVLISMAAMLDDLGHTAVEAGSGRQALQILGDGAAVDLVIADYAMPEMTGLQLAEEIGRSRPGLGVLLVTGHIGSEAPLAPGVTQLAKPFARNTLARAIEACVDQEPPAAARIFPFAPR